MEIRINPILVALSILIAILHSYVGFDLASRIAVAKGPARAVLVVAGV